MSKTFRMPSGRSDETSQAETIKRITKKVTGANAVSVEHSADVGLNRIYKVIAGGNAYAVKRYPDMDKDARDRLNTERRALQFFELNGLICVPHWVGASPPFAVMQWIEGKPVTAPNKADVEQAILFLSSIFHLSHSAPAAAALPVAAEACLSAAEIVRQIDTRLARLQAVKDKALAEFLHKTFTLAMDERLAKAEEAYRVHGWDFEKDLAEADRRLIPADFGFHNALRVGSQHLVFIDFEYFGWDDPVKLVADMLLHPVVPLEKPQRKRFHDAMLNTLGAVAAKRFAALYPLFGLRWALITLDGYQPKHKQTLETAQNLLKMSASYES